MKKFIAMLLALTMALSMVGTAWATGGTTVTDADGLKAALAAGGEITLGNDITVDANSTITVTGTAVLDLNNNTIAGVSNQTGANRSIIIVTGSGDLTVKNGNVTMEHKGDNMGWNNSTNALEAVSGGKLTLDHVNVTNLGGSDMAYAVNIGNNGGATLKTIASTLESVDYNALRIFNNADGAINVDLTEGSVLTGSGSPFFVHFWTEADLGANQEARQAYLKVNFNNTEVSRYSGSKSLIRFGFTDAIYYSDTAMTEVVAGSEAAFKWALENGKDVLLNNDLTVAATLNVTEDTVINGNNKTLTYTGVNRAIDVATETNGADLTINDLTIAFPAGYRERGINYNTTGTLTLNKVTVGDETAYPTYAVNFPGSANGATATIDECDLYGCIALNVWGKDMEIDVTDSNLTTVDNSDAEGYAVVKLNNDGVTAAEGTVINISGGIINIIGSGVEAHPSMEFTNGTTTGVINVDSVPGGTVDVVVAAIRYPDYGVSYSFYSVQDAINFAVDNEKATKENPVQVEVLKTAATNGGSYTPAEGVKLMLPEGYICSKSSATGDMYTVQKMVASNDASDTTNDATDTVVSDSAVIDAVKDTSNTSNTVTVPDSNNSEAKTTIEFTDGGKTKYVDEVTNNPTNPDITTQLAVSDVTEAVQDTVEAAVKAEVPTAVGAAAEVATYLDVDIHLFVADTHVGQITETPDEIKVVIPEELLPEFKEVPAGHTRKYYVVRVHGTEIETIPATMDADGNLIFYSDKFSTYAVVYEDTKVPSGGYYPSYTPAPEVNIDVDNGSLNDAAQAVGGAVSGGSAELKPVSGYTEAEIAKLQKEGKLNLAIVKKSGYTSAAEKDLIDAAITKAGGAVSGVAVMYFDITPVLRTDDGKVVANVTDTEKAISITLDLSAAMQKAAKDGKVIYVVRAHDGKAEFLSTKLSADKTKVTFSSADFSTFAVVALDEVSSPKTFDAGILLYAGMAVAAATGSAVVIGKKRQD